MHGFTSVSSIQISIQVLNNVHNGDSVMKVSVNRLICGLTGFCKKLKALAKQKDRKLVGKWEQSIINHLYWCVALTTNGNGNMMKAK